MRTNVSYDLLIIGGGISACVFASKFLQNNISKKIALIEVGRGLGGRSSTRISKRFKGWKLNHGAPNFNIFNSKNNLLLKSYIDELFLRYFEAKTHADIPPPIIAKSYVKSLFIITYCQKLSFISLKNYRQNLVSLMMKNQIQLQV